MYEPLLSIHSWMRWVLLMALIYLFLFTSYGALTKKVWTETHSDSVWKFTQLLLWQIAFGVTLWIAASPIVRSALINPQNILSNSLLNFWSLRHPMTMLSTFGVLHFGGVIARRRPNKFTVYAVTFGLILLLILSAIPWPPLMYGRPLFRGF